MDLQLKDKQFLVTGGSKGLGFACAEALMQEGARVALVSRSEENLKNAAEKLQTVSKSRVPYFVCNVQKAHEISAFGEWALNTFKRIDGVLLNAGGPPAGGALAFDDAAWQSALETTFLSVVRLTRLFIPVMRRQKYGRIAVIESSSVKQSIDNLALSNAVRPAVAAYLKTLSAETAIDNILINTILPGPTRTERLESLLRSWAEKAETSVEEITKVREAQIPLGRFGEPQELAALAAFLLSGKNTYITGQLIAVDGGYSKTVF